MKPTKEAAAAMAEHIYSASLSKDNVDLTVAGWRLIDIQKGSKNMKMGVYIPVENDLANPSEYVLAFKGSTFAADKETVDIWIDNILATQGSYSVDMRDTMLFSSEFCYAHQGNEITMVGHSRGGGQAIAAAKINGTNAITFNAANFNLKEYNLACNSDDIYKRYITITLMAKYSVGEQVIQNMGAHIFCRHLIVQKNTLLLFRNDLQTTK